MPRLAVYFHTTTVLLNNTKANSHAEARAFFFGGVKGFKNIGKIFFGNPNARIGELNIDSTR